MKKIIELLKKFFNNPKYSFLVAIFQGILLVVSFVVFHAFRETISLYAPHGGGEPPDYFLSVGQRLFMMIEFFLIAILPHIVLGLLQLNYLVRYVKKSDKPVRMIVCRALLLIICAGVIVATAASLSIVLFVIHAKFIMHY